MKYETNFGGTYLDSQVLLGDIDIERGWGVGVMVLERYRGDFKWVHQQ